MAAISHSTLPCHFRVVDRDCEEFPLVRKVFAEQIAPLYGDQTRALDLIGIGGSRLCEMLVEGSSPKGIIVYKKELNREEFVKIGAPAALELKTLILLDPRASSGKGFGTKLVEKIKEVAKSRMASHIVVTVSESKPDVLAFFQKRGFQDRQVETIRGKKEHLLSFPLSIKRARSELEAPAPAPAPVAAERRTEPLSVTLKQVYIDAIRSGRKTVEGRIDSGLFQRMQPGTLVKWFCQGNSVTTRIERVTKYPSFSAMLKAEGVEKCLPGVASVDAGIGIYHSIPGYPERSKESGVVALQLRVV